MLLEDFLIVATLEGRIDAMKKETLISIAGFVCNSKISIEEQEMHSALSVHFRHTGYNSSFKSGIGAFMQYFLSPKVTPSPTSKVSCEKSLATPTNIASVSSPTLQLLARSADAYLE